MDKRSSADLFSDDINVEYEIYERRSVFLAAIKCRETIRIFLIQIGAICSRHSKSSTYRKSMREPFDIRESKLCRACQIPRN
jgi:hypothetical protein